MLRKIQRIKNLSIAGVAASVLGVMFDAAVNPHAEEADLSDGELWDRLDWISIVRSMGRWCDSMLRDVEKRTQDEIARRGIKEPEARLTDVFRERFH